MAGGGGGWKLGFGFRGLAVWRGLGFRVQRFMVAASPIDLAPEWKQTLVGGSIDHGGHPA